MLRVVSWITWVTFQLTLVISGVVAKPPNILIFLADDLGYADLDWKDKSLHTPNLREYAFADGTAYLTNSYVLHLCTPTRSSLMTGYYPFRTGTQNGVFLPMERSGVPLDFPFLPQHLSKAGYRNYLIGKWHLGNCKRDFLPTARGFDYFYGYYSAQEGYFNHSLAFYDKHTDSMIGGLDLFTEVRGRPMADHTKNGVYATNLFTDEAIRIMSQHNRRDPFFMFLSHQSVHAPLQVPMQYRSFCNPLIMSKARHIYCGMLASLDESFGQVVKFLKESGLYDDTIIIFSSDNGGDPKAGASNLPLKGAKSSVWEGGCKTTTFIHSPKYIPGFGIRKDLFHVVDWHATLLGAAGVSIAKYGDGINQWPMITTGKSVGLRRNQMVYNIQPPLSALRNNDFKLVYESKGQTVTAGGRARLYHLPSDPFETRDIARQQPKLVRKLVKRLLEFQSVARPSVRTPIDPAGHPMRFGGAFSTGFCK
uniref:Sulfatase domain-containing protein n=1 Tax=Panagrellus redivivus TaxID=6233 RepID=A0A7E4VWJ0_PANRE